MAKQQRDDQNTSSKDGELERGEYGNLGINDVRFFTVFQEVMPTHVWWSPRDLMSLLKAVPKGSIGIQRVCRTRDGIWRRNQ